MRRFVRGELGQGTIEFALAFAMILMPLTMSLLEAGYLFSQTLMVNISSREGARMGGNLANGGAPLGCGAGQSPNAAAVDPNVIAAIERSLTANGALIQVADVAAIRIFKATSTGAETSGKVNIWTYALNGGPTVDGQPLDFVETQHQWDACSRVNTLPADSIGVTVRYTYRARTPLRYVFPSLATTTISDTTVMTLNATN